MSYVNWEDSEHFRSLGLSVSNLHRLKSAKTKDRVKYISPTSYDSTKNLMTIYKKMRRRTESDEEAVEKSLAYVASKSITELNFSTKIFGEAIRKENTNLLHQHTPPPQMPRIYNICDCETNNYIAFSEQRRAADEPSSTRVKCLTCNTTKIIG